jgi:hypothetical protein
MVQNFGGSEGSKNTLLSLCMFPGHCPQSGVVIISGTFLTLSLSLSSGGRYSRDRLSGSS